MAMPATSGKLCTSLSSMAIGDYIGCRATAMGTTAPDAFGNATGAGEMPLYGLDTQSVGDFYFIKVDKGLLIADRNIRTITGTMLNSFGRITGVMTNMGTNIGTQMLRSLSYAEWTQYITNSDLNGSIIKQDVNVWHTSGSISYENASNSISRNTSYLSILQDTLGSTRLHCSVAAGLFNKANNQEVSMHAYVPDNPTYNYYTYPPAYKDPSVLQYGYSTPTLINVVINLTEYACFRPVIEYIDNPKSTNMFF